MKLGIYVGSFNPVHNGHIKVANYLLEKGLVDKVIMIPTPNYWDKTNLVDLNKRIDMLRFFEKDNLIIDDKHNYPLTYQVLESLEKDYPNDELYLVIGSDNLENLHLWKNIDEILKHHIIVVRRNGDEISKYLERFDQSRFILTDDFVAVNVSSTEIRNSLNNKNVDKRVVDYIIKNKLYQE